MHQEFIAIEDICRKILKNTVLDIYYLIMNEKDISKSDIAHRFKEYDPDPDAKTTKFRNQIDIGIAKLEGAMFIESWQDGVSDRYFLTIYGQAAREIMSDLVKEDTMILNGSKITRKIMFGEDIK